MRFRMNSPPEGQKAEPLSTGESEDPFSQLFNLSPFPALISRVEDGRILAINARVSEIIGVGPSEVAGMAVTDYYVDPSERAQLAERIRRDGRADNVLLRLKRGSAG